MIVIQPNTSFILIVAFSIFLEGSYCDGFGPYSISGRSSSIRIRPSINTPHHDDEFGCRRSKSSISLYATRKNDDDRPIKKTKSTLKMKQPQSSSNVLEEKMKRGGKATIRTSKSTTRKRRHGKFVNEKSFKYVKKKGHAVNIFDNSALMDHDILTKEIELDLGEKVQKLVKVRKLAEELNAKKEVEEMEDLKNFHESYDDDDNGDSWIAKMYEDGDSSPSYGVQSTTDTSFTTTSSSFHKVVHEKEKKRDLFLQFTEDEVINKLQISGGKVELQTIIHNGTEARETLVKNNIRLVVSIAQKWCRSTLKSDGNADGGFMTLYNGGWSRPSLDEVIQEGVVGLAIAADRYDASRGFRFSTYATYWITNYVRKCFQTASTGALRIPPLYHHIKQKYRKALKTYYSEKQGSFEDMGFPAIGDLATEIGVSVTVLKRVLKLTRPLISIDQPLEHLDSPSPGGKAGSDMNIDNDLTLLDALPCGEPKPADQLERSMLRQCLENAMATELLPYERDVVRLRLGLDDGVTRTIREVAEVCGGALTVSEVRSAEARAFRKLRSPYSLHTHQLFNYFEFAGIEQEIIPNNDNNNGAATIATSPRYQF